MKKFKVRLDPESKKFFTVEEYQTAKKLVNEFNAKKGSLSEDCPANYYAELAVNALCGDNACIAVLETTAEVQLNARAWNVFFDGSARLDVWVRATARVRIDGDIGYVDVGAYLSDIWNVTGSDTDEIHSHAYIRRFTEGGGRK